MLYFAGTDWFVLSWRLLPLPTPHMVESAWSLSTACVREKHLCTSGKEKRDIYGEKQWGNMCNNRKKKRAFHWTCVRVACGRAKRASICAFFAIRQCVKTSRFDCRRFVSHKWWLTIHLPLTCTHASHKTCIFSHTSFYLLPSSTDREEYVQAALLMHIYTEYALFHLLSEHSKGYCVWVCVRARV